ncbi:MAG: protein kinase [Acidobacteria bacterium]|nr:protein kinase [Acidobacteriota bacterium]
MATLAAGDLVGRYQIISQLGAGGMGEVYLALDTQLDRRVALKLLSPELKASKERMRRFGQEARLTSSLNHPNILTIYEIGHTDAASYIVAEFVEGLTLRKHLSRGALKPAEALEVATQVCAALVAAHAAGVVHRDVKPENVMLRPDGYVKVLDFGLAKLTDEVALKPAGPDLSTATHVDTDPGAIIGTVAYMSPEQLRGHAVDARTDVWSLGVVLYEMLTGRRPFEGATQTDLIVSILERAPTPLPPDDDEISEELRVVVARALSKDREGRHASARGLYEELSALGAGLPREARRVRLAGRVAFEGADGATSRGGRATGETERGFARTGRVRTAHQTLGAEYLWSGIKRHGTVSLTLLLVVAAALGGLLVRQRWRAAAVGASRTTTAAGMKIETLATSSSALEASISPDGRYVALVTEDAGRQSLALKSLETSAETQLVAPTEARYRAPRFSRDGKYIYYLEQGAGEPTLLRVPAGGGEARKLLDGVSTPVTFSPDGKRVAFVRRKGDTTALVIADADGGGERELAVLGGVTTFSVIRDVNNSPSWSPDGRAIACPTQSFGETAHMDVTEVRVADGTTRVVNAQPWYLIGEAAWLPDGTALLMNAKDSSSPSSVFRLWRLAYPSGDAQPLTSDHVSYRGVTLTADARAALTTQVRLTSSVWVMTGDDPKRAEKLPSSQGKGNSGIAWAGDGGLVYTSQEGGNIDIWIMDAGSNSKRLTADASPDGEPSVSTDGRHVAFISDRNGATHVWLMNADGTDQRQLTFGSYEDAPQITPDGSWVVYRAAESARDSIWKVPLSGGEPTRITNRIARGPVPSPDGKLLACYSKDNGEGAVWKLTVLDFATGRVIKTFDAPPAAVQQWHGARWTPDGRALTYIVTRGGVSNLWSQPLDGSAARQLTDFSEDQILAFAWSPDGKRCALVRMIQLTDLTLIEGFV